MPYFTMESAQPIASCAWQSLWCTFILKAVARQSTKLGQLALASR